MINFFIPLLLHKENWLQIYNKKFISWNTFWIKGCVLPFYSITRIHLYIVINMPHNGNFQVQSCEARLNLHLSNIGHLTKYFRKHFSFILFVLAFLWESYWAQNSNPCFSSFLSHVVDDCLYVNCFPWTSVPFISLECLSIYTVQIANTFNYHYLFMHITQGTLLIHQQLPLIFSVR